MAGINLDDHEFGDGRYRFGLTVKGIEEIQNKCDAGIGAVFRRVTAGVYQLDGQVIANPNEAEFALNDIVETIRQGLIGGNCGWVDGREVTVNPMLANNLINLYVSDRPLTEGWTLAAAILLARMIGYDPPGKGEPGLNPAAEKMTAEP